MDWGGGLGSVACGGRGAALTEKPRSVETLVRLPPLRAFFFDVGETTKASVRASCFPQHHSPSETEIRSRCSLHPVLRVHPSAVIRLRSAGAEARKTGRSPARTHPRWRPTLFDVARRSGSAARHARSFATRVPPAPPLKSRTSARRRLSATLSAASRDSATGRDAG